MGSKTDKKPRTNIQNRYKKRRKEIDSYCKAVRAITREQYRNIGAKIG
jgi:hypothetical protein